MFPKLGPFFGLGNSRRGAHIKVHRARDLNHDSNFFQILPKQWGSKKETFQPVSGCLEKDACVNRKR